MSKYINEFEAMGGKFDQKTKEAFISQVNITSKNVEMMCKALGKGFNIVKLICRECSIDEGDLEKLLDIIINRSSIRCLNMGSVRVRNVFGITKYTCQEMVAEFNNQSLKVRFSEANRSGNTMMLARLLLQNKICRNLDFSASDFLDYESDVQRSLETNAVLTDLAVDLHIRNMRPTDQKEISLMKSLQKHVFISRLCISSSLISREFTEALLYASKEQSTLTYLEFYNCKVKKDDKAEMQSLYDNGSLPHLAFYEEPRWDVLLKETNGSLNR
ncbi:unnamed protein product, partial [Rotaria socialis]